MRRTIVFTLIPRGKRGSLKVMLTVLFGTCEGCTAGGDGSWLGGEVETTYGEPGTGSI
jgi:hypothetical protein